MATLTETQPAATAKDIVTSGPTEQVFSEYMANIIKKIPVPDELSLLNGPGNAQVSFIFQSPETGEINQNFYNNILSRRVKGGNEQHGVQQAELTESVFTNDYAELYRGMRFNLSQADQALLQRLIAETAGTIRRLVPVWNDWVDAAGQFEEPPVQKLDPENTRRALVVMTATLLGPWLNPHKEPLVRQDPSYPYVHMNEFDDIFNRIPFSVPTMMRDFIKGVLNAQGAAGGLTSRESNATQTRSGIINNIEKPSAANGGLPLTGSDRRIPGVTFQPDDPTVLTDILGNEPPTQQISYKASISKASSTQLSVEASGGGSIQIPILDFFSVNVSGGAKASIFQEDFAGSRFSVEVTVNNPTIAPQFTTKPLLYSTSTLQGWLNATPIKEAIANAGKSDVTGWVFNSGLPPFNFAENGDFGVIQSLVLSQFLQLSLTFEECTSHEVRRYFEQHSSATFNFLGIPLGGASTSSKYSFSYRDETSSKITIEMKPNPPGYTPGGTGSGITGSLCNLVAVGVAFPFA